MPARLDPDGVQRLTLMGGNYHFQPDRIRVQVGVPVELEVYRTTRTPHLPSHRDRGMWGVLEVID
ncbi:hypothetical protein D1793_10690 [Halomonas sp. JS92-SW72]|nr:hypothetical protein D1793_10690 [Halomonas sp. JS92-SW72]